ncbi:PREDICTED: etoposide-induced protein 2.4 homolog [Priapulus caudatus]|uniref:Etoposide-induced protein 2.4 homolog n=1 Tax=Priapulus caudatus TaxID=37621 RepID=A0ABM1F2D9_PRICU|nr:PREDICTED: etoposide-induced protein 2.4 homolog [Priapulus caudatus]
MADALRAVLRGVVRGMRDAILGMGVLHKLYDTQIEEVEVKKEATSVLARRREAAKAESEKTTSATPKSNPPKLFHRIIQCCALNGGVFWLSIVIFYKLVLPFLHFVTHFFLSEAALHSTVWSYVAPSLSYTFSALWVLPLFLLSKIVNSLWFQDIADAAYKKTRGKPQLMPSVSRLIADILFSLLVQALFLVQVSVAVVIRVRPRSSVLGRIGESCCLMHFSRSFRLPFPGWEVQKRISYIEMHWPYFIGFGLPLAVLTALPSSLVVSGCVFSILFPLFIISANEAAPISEIYTDTPLQLFALSVRVSNAIFRTSVRRTTPQTPTHGTPRHVPPPGEELHTPTSTPERQRPSPRQRRHVRIQED